MSKYSSLPDIDTAPDIFETSDEPEPPLRPASDNLTGGDEGASTSKSSLIDGSALPDRRRAERAFGRSRRKDGSYQLGLPPLSRHDSSSDEKPLIPKETPAARLRRLKAELAEVERELGAGSPSSSKLEDGGENNISQNAKGKRKSVLPPREPVDLMKDLAGLKERLTILGGDDQDLDIGASAFEGGWMERMRSLNAGYGALGNNSLSNGINGNGDSGGVEDKPQGYLTELDRRLATLEDLIGTSGEGLDQSPSSPLLSTMTRLDNLLSLLTQPRHLDAISRRIKLLLVDLDRAAAASRRSGTSQASSSSEKPSSLTLPISEYNQLQTLFQLLPRMDPLLPVVNPLLNRLRSLSGLHSEASEIAESLRRIEHEDKSSNEELKELKVIIEGMKKGLDDSGKAVLKNWEGVEGRMKGLEDRLKALNS